MKCGGLKEGDWGVIVVSQNGLELRMHGGRSCFKCCTVNCMFKETAVGRGCAYCKQYLTY